MGQAAFRSTPNAHDFLAWEALQPTKHEFVHGEVFAMVGAAKAHVIAALNIAFALRQHLRGTPCRTDVSDTKVRVDAADAFLYPDVVVSCSANDAADPLLVREPVLLVEVLSPATAGYDRGAKFAQYRLLPSLQEFVLIDPDARQCDVFRKADSGQGLWTLHPFDKGQGCRLDSVDLTINAAILWDPLNPHEPAMPA